MDSQGAKMVTSVPMSAPSPKTSPAAAAQTALASSGRGMGTYTGMDPNLDLPLPSSDPAQAASHNPGSQRPRTPNDGYGRARKVRKTSAIQRSLCGLSSSSSSSASAAAAGLPGGSLDQPLAGPQRNPFVAFPTGPPSGPPGDVPNLSKLVITIQQAPISCPNPPGPPPGPPNGILHTSLSSNSDRIHTCDRTTRQATRLVNGGNGDHLMETHSPSSPSQFWTLLGGLVADIPTQPSGCSHYFKSLDDTLANKYRVPKRDVQSFCPFFTKILHILLDYTTTEKLEQSAPLDPFAKGLVSLLLRCLSLVDTLPAHLPPRAEWAAIAEQLFWRFLLPQPRVHHFQPPVSLLVNRETRAELYDVVFQLVKNDETRFSSLLSCLEFLDPDEPIPNDPPDQIERSEPAQSRAAVYVGLKNFGSTCYINSLVTQLFMNTEFRRLIISQGDRRKRGLIFEMRKLFLSMQDNPRSPIYPTSFIRSLTALYGGPVDVGQQVDVAEFFDSLLRQLDEQCLDSDERDTLNAFFGGHLVQQIKSTQCEHTSDSIQLFHTIACDIINMASLEESLHAYVAGEDLKGDNIWSCEGCGRHQEAVKSSLFGQIPDNLWFQLKRFTYDARDHTMKKVDDYFSFPLEIDMRPYTMEGGAEEDVFELVGIIVHTGDCGAGHYYSYTRERTSSSGKPVWFKFNDSEEVVAWDPVCMEADTFGGSHQTKSRKSRKGMMRPSAYMLNYQRLSPIKKEEKAMSVKKDDGPRTQPQFLFDEAHAKFIENCFHHAKKLWGKVPGHPGPHQAMGMALTRLDQVVSRSKVCKSDFEASPTMMMIEDAVLGWDGCTYALERFFFRCPDTFQSLLQVSENQAVRECIKNLFFRAHMEDTPEDIIKDTMVLFLRIWEHLPLHVHSWDEAVGVIFYFASLGDRHVAHFLAQDFLRKAITMVQKSSRQSSNGGPSYAAILSLIDHLLHFLDPVATFGDAVANMALERLWTPQPPFKWTRAELKLVHQSSLNHFVEKMLRLDQARKATSRILRRLIKLNEQVEMGIATTLMENLRRDSAGQPRDPFLRAASQFLKATQSPDTAMDLIEHIGQRAMDLQDAEVPAFLEFFAVALDLGRESVEHVEMCRTIRESALATVGNCAPILLTSADCTIRSYTALFIVRKIVSVLEKSEGEITTALPARVLLERTLLNMAIACLVRLRGVFRAGNVDLGRQMAKETILPIICTCSRSSTLRELESLRSELLEDQSAFLYFMVNGDVEMID